MSNSKQRLLAEIAKDIHSQHVGYIEKLKLGHHELQRPDFIWHFLLQSFATMGKSSGWKGLIGNKYNYNKITYEALTALDHNGRAQTVKAVCHASKVRMPEKKADYILGCYERVRDIGGLESAKTQLLSCSGREGKIKFLKQFPGIGEKYARNIMMDVYHEDFHSSIAIDIRIKSITELLGLSFNTYEEQEIFLLEVAKLADLNGWELDRLMYRFKSDFEYEILSA
ncbi:hypothetical protein LYZ37_18995 [Vibrio tubiashii]|uniref:hypothetical protein n=1 Tax=Vibrio tubiashii TaxID=29498 RepID=UPI00234EEE9F|nr:hypothetical protein [Vibrio tubiashii]WCP70091.1 hypothetical protein LYZ37_18995 [Vibrio tubiashii]